MTLLITADHLAAIAGRRTSLMLELAHWISEICPRYEIDARQEYCHFLAQACHETGRFKTLREYASGAAYEGRVDLGNTQPGDGVKFKGRGIFQTTGRANYLQLGIKLGRRDLFIQQPELLEKPEYAVWSACEFWRSRRLNDVANHADNDVLKKKYRGKILEVSPVEYISITINGGYNGVSERKRYYAAAQAVLPLEVVSLPMAVSLAPTTTSIARIPHISGRKKAAKKQKRHKAGKAKKK
jgi:putative chitinase